MKLLIVGSRSIDDFDLSAYVLPEVDTIISGGARGVDSLAEQYADSRRISKDVIRPNYLMVDMADAVLVIWDGRSKGTQYILDYAKKNNKPLIVVCVP